MYCLWLPVVIQLHSILLINGGPLQGLPASNMTTQTRGHGTHDTASVGQHILMLILWQLHDLVTIMTVSPDLPGLQHIK